MNAGGLSPAPVVRVDTLRHPAQRHLIHVVLTAADGAAGLGETFWAAGAVEAYVHEVLSPRVLEGASGSPGAIREACSRNLYGSPRGPGAVSVETAAASALDIAAWDLAARRAATPLAEWVAATRGGGEVRRDVPTYNTCVDPDAEYVPAGNGPHHDYTATFADARGLAEDLLADGFSLMKVFPFTADGRVEAALGAVRAAASVPGMSVAVDLYDQFDWKHGRRVAEALDGLGLAWIEDPFPGAGGAALEEFARGLSTPLCTGEALAGRGAHQRLVDGGGVALVHYDLSWGGGVSGAFEAAAAAASAGLAVVFHDCTGPVAWAASAHAARCIENASYVESVRTLVRGAYPEIADGLPGLSRGRVAPGGPGHGCSLTERYRAACSIRTTHTSQHGGGLR